MNRYSLGCVERSASIAVLRHRTQCSRVLRALSDREPQQCNWWSLCNCVKTRSCWAGLSTKSRSGLAGRHVFQDLHCKFKTRSFTFSQLITNLRFQYKFDCRVTIEMLENDTEESSTTNFEQGQATSKYVDRYTNPAHSGRINSRNNSHNGTPFGTDIEIKTEKPDDDSVSGNAKHNWICSKRKETSSFSISLNNNRARAILWLGKEWKCKEKKNSKAISSRSQFLKL